MPPRLDTWIGLSSQIRSAVTTERRWFAFLCPTRGERFRTGSSTLPDNMAPAPLSVDSISLFFRYALSLTAWKRFEGTTWSLRANPSSGNLHPTEGYVLLPSLDAIHDRPGVYHYASKAHGLELRADFDPSVWAALTAAFPEGSFLVGLSSILWREAWKYGERAFRYCQHDVGHALGSMRFAAAALGWKLRLLDRVGSAAVSQLLGLDREADYDRRGARASRTRGTCGQGEMGQRPGPLPVQRVGIPGGQLLDGTARLTC